MQSPRPPLPSWSRFVLHACVVLAFLIVTGTASWLTERRLPLRSLEFRGPAPEGRPDYLHFFGAPVRFDRQLLYHREWTGDFSGEWCQILRIQLFGGLWL